MKLWVDDIRPKPDDFDLHAKTTDAAVELLSSKNITEISLDHDLGDETVVGSGYRIAIWIEHAAYRNQIPRLKWSLHTANPVGKKKMEAALDTADYHWDYHEKSKKRGRK